MLIKMEKRKIKFCEAIGEALEVCLKEDESVFIIGEGVPDPRGLFGTTVGLQEKYGDKRILDMPLSENGMTGVCIGAAMTGMRPILMHQRIDFTLLSLDQIINNAAKWHYMFGGQLKAPLVIRMVIGRGWGQGAQHSQNLQALYAHIPGLKVVMPSNAYDAKGLMISAVRDNNPVIFIEHRWLHNILDYVPDENYSVPIGKANVVRDGEEITIVATSYMVVEAIKTADYLKNKGISVEVIDVRTLKPLDDKTILESVSKTGRLLVMDAGYYTGGFAGEIIARVTEKGFSSLRCPPKRITLPDHPTPSTPGLTKYYYPRVSEMVSTVASMLGREVKPYTDPELFDVPDKSFTGPF
jgi:acetoin:2,6-dichlorophenolindophenol oxidoreductase subunit beta